MAMDALKDKYVPQDNSFYRANYHLFFYAMMGALVGLLLVVGLVLFQLASRPLPVFMAKQSDGKTMELLSFDEPNLLPETIIRFASKAAVTTYTFNYVNYDSQLALARPYFTEAGWNDFKSSISGLVSTIAQNQLFVSGVVSGPPVISNQGPLPGKGYVWRVQVPFLLTYQSSNSTVKRKYFVIVTIVRVPTSVNPQGIGIDQFVTA
jgi:intracellular multiplication protein IcmL